jgi:hypothetical protein
MILLVRSQPRSECGLVSTTPVRRASRKPSTLDQQFKINWGYRGGLGGDAEASPDPTNRRCQYGSGISGERHSRHVVLRRLPGRVVPGIGGEDEERLTVEIGQGRRLMYRRARHYVLLDELARWRAVDALARASSRERGGTLP